MSRIQRQLFWIAVGIGAFAGLWCYAWYSATVAVYSDLPQYGIRHGSAAYTEIVSITQRQIRVTTLPLAGLTIAAFAGWASILFASAQNRTEEQPQT